MEKALARLVAQSQKSFGDIERSGTQAENALERVGRGGAKGAADLEKASRAATAQTANLSAQLQDVAVQLQGGGSPFTIAAQQGFQLASALGPGGAGAAVKALGAGFMAFLSPVNLVTVGLIALTGYAVQYATELLSGSDASTEALRKQADAIGSLATKWGEAVPSLKEYADRLKKAADAKELLDAQKQVLDDTYAGAKVQFKGTVPNAANVKFAINDSGIDPKLIADFGVTYSNLTDKMADNQATVTDVVAVQTALNAVYKKLPIQDIADFNIELNKIKPSTDEAAEGAKSVREQFDKASGRVQQLGDVANKVMQDLSGFDALTTADFVRDLANAVTGNLKPGLEGAVQALQDFASSGKLLQYLQDDIEKINSRPARDELEALVKKAEDGEIGVADIGKAIDALAAKNAKIAGPLDALKELIEAAVRARDAITDSATHRSHFQRPLLAGRWVAGKGRLVRRTPSRMARPARAPRQPSSGSSKVSSRMPSGIETPSARASAPTRPPALTAR